MTKMKLDRTVYDSLIPWNEALAFMNEHHIGSASKGTWEKRSKLPGFPVHRPNGGKGKRYVIPAEVDHFLRSRCTEQTPGQDVAP
jgi:hypothetical protein